MNDSNLNISDVTETFKKYIEDTDYNWESFIKEVKGNANKDEVIIKNVKNINCPLILKQVHDENHNLNFKFIECDFNADLTISNSNRTYKYEFDNCSFNSDIKVQLANDNKTLSINNSKINKSLAITLTHSQNNRIDLEGCEFHDELNFMNTGQSVTDLTLQKSVFFKNLPNLKEINLNNLFNYNNFDLKENSIIANYKSDFKKNKFNDLPEIARDLKLRAAGANDHLREMDFFAIESQTRAIKDGGFAKILSYSYKVTSDFGRSISRPLMLLALLFISLAVGNNYQLLKRNLTVLDKENLVAVYVVTTKTILPLTLGFNKGTVDSAKKIVFGENEPSVLYQTVRIIIIGFSLVLWFLFFFAIRNRFKIS